MATFKGLQSAVSGLWPKLRTPHCALILFVFALLAWIYYPTFLWMAERWSAADSYYSHGFLIPLVSIYFAWRKRKEIASSERKESVWGVCLLIAAALVQAAAGVLRIYFASAFSFVLLLAGLIGTLYGTKVLRRVWFPLFFLTLMIPLPLLVISQVTLKMKFFITDAATLCMNAAGIRTVREGSYLVMPHSYLLVGDPCSGLRSFLAFLCLGLAFAHLSRSPWWGKAVLVTAGLPLAIFSNLLRVLALAFIAEIYGMEAAGGKVHDLSGIFAFVIAFFCFLAIQRKLEAGRD